MKEVKDKKKIGLVATEIAEITDHFALDDSAVPVISVAY
jgi:hypothetical protein